MKYTRYHFEEITDHKESRYIFQYVTNRKLTDVYHSHSFFEVCVMLSGTATELFNGQPRLLEEGTVVLLKPEEKHCFVDQSPQIKMVCLSVEREEALRLLEAFGVTLPQKDVIFSIGTAVSRIADLTGIAADEHHYRLLFCQILSLYLDSRRQGVPHLLQNAVQQMRRFENLQRGIPRLVELSGYSRSHLTRLVQRYYHVSLQELITRQRMDAAYNEVILSKDPMEDIACKVGYASFSHFHKTFKTTFGITPAALRRTHAIRTI